MKKYIFDMAKKAKACCYGSRRMLSSIKGIVIHNTNDNPAVHDTAKNNMLYFASENAPQAGAHIFIDRWGITAYSIPLTRVAYSVGNQHGWYQEGAYGNILNNTNTISIELCDIADQPPSELQLKALENTIRWLTAKNRCKNVAHIVRHYDIVKKNCPVYYVKHADEWKTLHNNLVKIMKGAR